MRMIWDKIKSFLRNYYDSHEQFLKSLRKKGAKVGDNVQIIDRSRFLYEPWFANLIEIEDNVVISAGVRLVSHDSSYANIAGGLPIKYGRIVIKKNAYIGVNAILLCGITIGENALIGAGSVVNKDIPSNSIAAGNPAKVIDTLENGLEKYRNKISNNTKEGIYYIDLGGSYKQMKEAYGKNITNEIIKRYRNFFKEKD